MLERKESISNGWQTGAVAASYCGSWSNIEDSEVTPGKSYSYYVIADGLNVSSNIVTVTIPTPTPKPTAKPTATPKVTFDLWVAYVTEDSVELAWQCNTKGVAYELQLKIGDDDTWMTAHEDVIDTAGEIYNVFCMISTGTNWYFRIVAKNFNATSDEIVVYLPETEPTPRPYNGYAKTKFNCSYFSIPQWGDAYKLGVISQGVRLNVLQIEEDDDGTKWAYVVTDDGTCAGYVRNSALQYE